MKGNLLKNKSGASAGLITAFFFAVVVLIFITGLLPSSFDVVKDTVLGVFGLAAYAYCGFVIFVASVLFFGVKIVVPKLTLVKFAAFFVVFLMLLHSLTAQNFVSAGFEEYCEASFENANTAGGLIFAVLTYHILSALGLPSALALYGILLFGILLIIFIPYLRNGRERTKRGEPSLTTLKDGKVTVEPVIYDEPEPPQKSVPKFAPKPAQRPLFSAPKPPQANGFSIAYPNKPVDDDAKRRRNSAARLFENTDAKITVDSLMPDGSEVITVKRTAPPEPEAEIDIENYTNNGRRKILEQNSKNLQSAGAGGGYYRPSEPPREVRRAENRDENPRNGYGNYGENPRSYNAEDDRKYDGGNESRYENYDEEYSEDGGKYNAEGGENYGENPRLYTAENDVKKYGNYDESYDNAENDEGYGKNGGKKYDGGAEAPVNYDERYTERDDEKYNGGAETRGDYGEKEPAPPPSYLSADVPDIRRRLKEETDREKAEREAADKKRREEEIKESKNKGNAGGILPEKKQFGFYDGEGVEFKNVKEAARQKREKARQAEKEKNQAAKGEIEGEKDELSTIKQNIIERNDRLLNSPKDVAPEIDVTPPDASGNPYPADPPTDIETDPFGMPESENPLEKLVGKPFPQGPLEPIRREAKSLKPWERSGKGGDEQLDFLKKPPTKPVRRGRYISPHVDLLLDYPPDRSDDALELEENINKLEVLFTEFKINATAKGAIRGPTFTRYEMQMPPGVSVSKVMSIYDDISMRLEASVRIEAPIPGKNAFGIEVPNKKRSIVGMRDLVNDTEFYEGNEKGLLFTLGQDIAGKNYYGDLTEMTHLLIAGSTGSGKSCCLNALIVSLLYKYSPEDVKLILIDPKQVELSMYSGIPHLLLPEPIVDDDKAINALDWVIRETTRRYSVMKENGVNNIIEYNKKAVEGEHFYRIIIIVDEVSELMIRLKREFEDRIKSVTQLARAAGIHVVLATQRPSVDVITGVIKTNLPSRIAFGVKSNHDSQTILGMPGAERLLGKGDMLFQLQTLPEPIRLQGVFISNSEINTIVGHIKANNESYFDAAIDEEINAAKEAPQESGASGNKNDGKPAVDPLFEKAVLLVIENDAASISVLQRKFSIGYARAARIVDMMEDLRIIGKGEGAKPRSILMTEEEFYETYGEMLDDDEE
jgi:S-DNA-T family DNA segregation ATPase FtsK/SpoIIIE